MLKDIYPVSKYPFEDLLLKNNYKLNEETFKIFICDKYCIHRIKTKGENSDEYIPCRRKKIEGKDFCGKHAPSDVSFKNKCIYSNCKRTTKKYKLCPTHKKYLNKICNTPLPIPDEEEIIFFGHNIYNCEINKKTKIIIKDYVLDGDFIYNPNDKLIKYTNFSLNKFLTNIYNKYKSFILYILDRYNINVNFLYNLLKLIYDEFNKTDKKVSVLSNSNVNISKKKKKKKKKKNINNIDFSNIFEDVKEYRNKIIIEHNLDIMALKDEDFIINYIFKPCLSYFNDKTEINKIYNNMLDISIKTDITPVDDNTDKILSLEEYIHKIKNTNFDIKKYKENILYVEKYLEFIFKSYNLAYNNKPIITNIQLEIIKDFIEGNPNNSKIILEQEQYDKDLPLFSNKKRYIKSPFKNNIIINNRECECIKWWLSYIKSEVTLILKDIKTGNIYEHCLLEKDFENLLLKEYDEETVQHYLYYD